MQENNKNQDNTQDTKLESASNILNRIYDKHIEDNIKIGVLLKSVDSGGFALLNLIFSIIIVVPTPPPIATISSLIIIFFSIQMIIGLKEVWLPKFITEKSIKRTTLALIVGKSSLYLSKLEKFTRRRLTFMNSDIAEKIIGLILFVLAVVSLTPIIFANSIPGLAIIMISFGLLNKDGLIIILGFATGFVGIFIAWLILAFGQTLVFKILGLL
ncbi:MAG TPA: exopolysaccharide biosynthesis protein [Rickettsiales bacterium]|nr:exopolysaccharide biosynthesis protein [Rickettsiales bacterium]